VSQIIDVGNLASGLFTGVGGMVIVGYIRDRRMIKAKGDVAAGTVHVRIEEDRLSLLRQTQDAEREVWNATTAHLRAELAQERMESDEKDRKIAELVRLVDEVREEAKALQTKLDMVERRLAAITGGTPPAAAET
jgi:chromosome segregation ATPase